jgi:type IV pilus assembly protein PilA
LSLPRPTDERGFTLVELLVVILIISVLAAVAIPALLDQRDKAHDSNVVSTLTIAGTAMDIYGLDHSGYCGSDVSDLVSIEPSLTNASGLQVTACPDGDDQSYALSDSSNSTAGTSYTVTVTDGVVARTCSTPGKGECSSSGRW